MFHNLERSSLTCRVVSFRLGLLAAVFLAVQPAAALDVLVSADAEGKLEPCAECPQHLGGIARRATLAGKLREEVADLLLVDAGNFLIGAETRASGGGVVVDAYNAMGYDAVNVSYRDFRLGKAATLEALEKAAFSPVSANLLDSESGEPLFKPHVVKEIGGQRVAVIGLTESPPGLERLPHLTRQLAGVRIAPAGEALRKALAEVEASSDLRVLLYYGSAASLAVDVGELAGSFAVIALGGAEPESLPPALAARCATALEHGRGMGRATLAAAGDGAAPQTTPLEVPADTPSDPIVGRLVAEEYKRQAEVIEAAKAEAAVVSRVPSKPRGNQAFRFMLQAENRGMSLAVKTVSFPYSFGGVGPTHGTRLMAVDMSFGSNVAMDLVLELDYPEQVQVASSRRQLFGVLNGKWICPLAARAPEMFGHLPDGFRIRDPGRPVVGPVVFELPLGEEIHSLELRFYHDQYSPIVLPLREAETPPSAEESKVLASEENADVGLSIAGFAKLDSYGSRRAPEGRKVITVDLVGRSRMATTTDAVALDAAGEPDRKVPQPKVMEYQLFRDMIHLLGDGHVAFVVDTAFAALPDPLYFLPDLPVGYRLAFAVPETRAASLELRCFFPEMKLTDQKAFRQPRPLHFPLVGDSQPPALRSALAVIRDTPIQVGIMHLGTVDQIGGRKPRAKYKIAVMDIKLVNAGRESGMLTIHDRFRLGWTDRSPISFSQAYARSSDQPPLEPMYMHVGEQRSFRLAWSVPLEVDECFLDYKGVALSTRVELSLGKIASGEQAAEQSFDPPTAEAKPLVFELEPVGIEGFGIRGVDVNRAIDRGRDFLWNLVKTEDRVTTKRVLGWKREHGLAALALVHTGAHRKYPEFDAALRRMLVEAKPAGTYDLGFYCMLIDAYGDPTFYDRLRLFAQTLVDRQGPRGTWGYGAKPDYPPDPPKGGGAGAGAKAPGSGKGGLVVEGGDPIADTDEGPGGGGDAARQVERQTDWESGDDGDFSTTQFAVLGLRSAERRGFKIPRRTWQRVHDSFVVGERAATGGWGYIANSTAYGSMTCAGLGSMAIARHLLEEEKPLAHAAIFRAERWMDTNFSAASNPKKKDYFFYYIYSLERVGQLFDTDFIGRHEWYPMGVRVLLGKQKDNGSWIGGRGETDERIATSFALLFLVRATEKLDPEPPPKPTGPGTLVTKYKPPPPRDLYIILDASGSMLAKTDGKRKFDIARDAVVKLIESVPDNTNVALRVYGHRKRAIAKGADEDTALEIRMGKLNRKAFLAKLRSLRPRGKTPLSLSLEQAAKDLGAVRSPVALLLLTDGGEDTRSRRDPVKTAAVFAKSDRIALRIVGFDINRASWTRQLEAMAEAGGGEYWPIASASKLAAQVGSAVSGAPPAFAVSSPDGKTVAEGVFGTSVELPPGRYLLRIDLGSRTVEHEIGVRPGGSTRVTLDPEELESPR